jgi:hypothetical protein
METLCPFEFSVRLGSNDSGTPYPRHVIDGRELVASADYEIGSASSGQAAQEKLVPHPARYTRCWSDLEQIGLGDLGGAWFERKFEGENSSMPQAVAMRAQ